MNVSVASQDISILHVGLSGIQDNHRIAHPRLLLSSTLGRWVGSVENFDLDVLSLEHGRDGKLFLLLDHLLTIVQLGADL